MENRPKVQTISKPELCNADSRVVLMGKNRIVTRVNRGANQSKDYKAEQYKMRKSKKSKSTSSNNLITPRAINKLYSATNKQYSTSSHKQHSTQPASKQYSTQTIISKQYPTQPAIINNTQLNQQKPAINKQYSTQPTLNNNK